MFYSGIGRFTRENRTTIGFLHRGGAADLYIETLREFITIAQLGSYTAAAKKLYISQPTLSKHIAALEKSLGHKLFFDEQPLILTEAGRILMDYASKTLSRTETMELKLAALKEHAPELVKIQDLTFFDFISGEARKVKEAVRRRYPSVTFDVRKCKTYQSSLAALLDGDIDVGFMFNIAETPFDQPELAVHSGYRSLLLVDYAGEFRLGVPKNSPLLDKGPLTLKDFADQRFCAIASNHYDSLIEDFRALCMKEGFLPQIEYETVQNYHDFWTRDHGDGIIFFDLSHHKDFTAIDDYLFDTYKPVRPFGRERTLYITITMIVRDEDHGPALTAFLETAERINRNRAEKLKAAEQKKTAQA